MSVVCRLLVVECWKLQFLQSVGVPLVVAFAGLMMGLILTSQMFGMISVFKDRRVISCEVVWFSLMCRIGPALFLLVEFPITVFWSASFLSIEYAIEVVLGSSYSSAF